MIKLYSFISPFSDISKAVFKKDEDGVHPQETFYNSELFFESSVLCFTPELF